MFCGLVGRAHVERARDAARARDKSMAITIHEIMHRSPLVVAEPRMFSGATTCAPGNQM
jgi:hypothetical protein